MPNKSSNVSIETLLIHALKLEENIAIAIENNEDEKANQFSLEYETYAEAILSYSTTTLGELKHKANFSEKLIKPDHNDPEMVSDVFTNLVTDIENLKLRYKDVDSLT